MADDAVVPTARKRRREDLEVVHPIVHCELDFSARAGSPLPPSSVSLSSQRVEGGTRGL